ncbi:NDP-hexose 2,3-dehydratase family protein [Streptomyces sp. NPDC002793]|uniref:NDP-hexose 2,3-dehydratase family protein n=1 Tax=Streptomyces sp. NPDC002793 TaxID=3154432 RepID=UPI0033213CF1
MNRTSPQSPRAATADEGRDTATRLAVSALAHEGLHTDAATFRTWLADCRDRTRTTVELRPLETLRSWRADPHTGDIGHTSGGFFTVRGLDVEVPGAAVERWQQPIISQPEVGILGILVKEFGGVLHFLMQAKAEPGNINGIQLSPTVQATRSNYTGVHGGKAVPYLDHFRDTARHRVLADVRQSEQGAWFHHKVNRNMIVEVTEPVDLLDSFCWLTLAQLHSLLLLDDMVNMDARTVLSCLPVSGPGAASAYPRAGHDRFGRALDHSADPGFRAAHTDSEILGWITEERTRQERRVREIPLDRVVGWHLRDGRIRHENDLFFDVVGVAVEAVGREVGRWEQPMIAPRGTGLVALLVREFDGVLHVLLHARVEAGHLDVLELAPTVQCIPDTYEHLPPAARPRFLDTVLAARPENVRFDAVHSEEGGRFLHARTRYMVVESDAELPLGDCPEYRWLALHQTGALLRHSHYLNIQARSVIACLHSLAGRPPAGDGTNAHLGADGRAEPEGRRQT